MDADRIYITKDHYFKNAYIIDLPLDATPDHACNTSPNVNGKQVKTCGKENFT